MLREGESVFVEKVSSVDSPECETPTWDQHEAGKFNPNLSLPVEYSVEGSLVSDLAEGRCMVVRRVKRNGEEIDGIMQTSPVQNLENTDEGVVVETLNSIYVVKNNS